MIGLEGGVRAYEGSLKGPFEGSRRALSLKRFFDFILTI